MSSSYQRLMAIDPSLSCSGWALFDVSAKRLLAVGKIRSLPASHSMAVRLLDIHQKVARVFSDLQLAEGDVLICEAPTTMRDPRAAFQVEQVRCTFETLARVGDIIVPGRLNPRSVQYEVMGLKGKQLDRAIVKHTAVQTVQAVYGEELRGLGLETGSDDLRRHQDIVDAILIGALGLTRLESSETSGMPLPVLFEQGASHRSSRRLPKAAGS